MKKSKMGSLLEKAKAESLSTSRRIYSKEDAELAVAWVNGDVNTTAVTKALWGSNASVAGGQRIYTYVCGALKTGVKNGWIKALEKKK